MDVVNGSLEEKMTTGRDYDRVIQEAEQVGLFLCRLNLTADSLWQAYTKILESSQVLLNVVQTRSQDLRTNSGAREERRGSGGGLGKPAHFITSTTPDSGFHQAK